MDEIGLLTASSSIAKNAKVLEREVQKITELGKKQAIQFDLAKTERLHFVKGKMAKSPITLPSREVVYPATKAVRWLGMWFDAHLTFKEHTRHHQHALHHHKTQTIRTLASRTLDPAIKHLASPKTHQDTAL
jgi:hypothetical protein